MALEVTPPKPGPFRGATTESYGGVPALLGLPDGIATAIRTASQELETYSPEQNLDLKDVMVTDYGDLVLKTEGEEALARQVGDACLAVLTTSAVPIFLGETHALTPGAVRASLQRFPNLAVIQINAHADFKQEQADNKWHEQCAMQRVLDRLPQDRLVSLGVRSGSREEFEAVHDQLNRVAAYPIYLSLDLSIFDEVFLPGLKRPEPGGLDWHAVNDLLKDLPWDNIIGCDIVGLRRDIRAPKLLAKLVREITLRIISASGLLA